MKIKRLLPLLAAASALLAGCHKPDESAAAGGPKPLHLAFVTNNAADFWAIARKGTEQAQKDVPNITVDFLIPSDATAAEQKRIVDDLLAKGVDGIALSPIDPANQVQFLNDTAKQALVFTQDSDAPTSDRTCYIGTDNVAAGRQAGEAMKKALPAGGKIMVFVGKIDAQNAKERYQGLKEALNGTNVQVLDVRTDNTDQVRAKANVTDTLVSVPDIAGMVGLWSYNGPAIVNAVKDAGKIGQVKIVCFDEEDQTLAGVKDGSISATIVQQPFEFGRLAITNMARYLRGDKSAVPDGKKIIVPTLTIDQSKVDPFIAHINELRGRPGGAVTRRMAAPLLELKGVTKRFPGVTALGGVSLEVYPGEIVALIGENGAGKSTLLKILGGVHQPDEGTVCIGGAEVKIHSVSDAMRHGIGFIHQELNVLENVDVAGNIFLGREPRRGGPLQLIDRRRIHAEAARHLQRLGLKIPTETRVGDLPIAYRQMVEIAKALSLETRILLMDEPTSSLTLSETEKLLQVALDLRAEGVSIIYISHRLSEVQRIADRVVALRDGRNAGGLAKEEINHERMVKLMVGRDLIYRQPAASARGGACLEVRGLRTRRYPERSVSFDVERGEIVGFAGLVGAGRSEIAQVLFGVDAPAGGSIRIHGKPLPPGSPAAAIREGIYLIPEDRRRTGLVTALPIRENITLPALREYARAGLLDFPKEKEASERLARELRVKCSSTAQRVATLSGGNQQKVVLAKWLALRPRLLIFDEPTRGIDVGAKAEIYELMRGLAEKGVAVMMISSDMEEVLGESQRVIVMHEGAVAGILERGDCNEQAIMNLAVGHGSAAAA